MAMAAGAQSQSPKPEAAVRTDATFVFTADVHVAFDSYDDHQGIDDDVYNQGASKNDLSLIGDETSIAWPNVVEHHDGCIGKGYGFEKDLCNDIQLVRKLNHLTNNTWNGASFNDANGHATKLGSAGQRIAAPRGVVIGGDLTDCGAGSDNVNVGIHSEHCDYDYKNGVPGAELTMFEQLFDKFSGVKLEPLNLISVIPGLKNPDSDVPLQWNVYPGLGNHDLGFDQSGKMMDYIRQWTFTQIPTSPRYVTNNDSNSGAYSLDWGRLHIVNVGVFAGSSNTSEATDSNYAYSQDAMNWLIKDLKSFASDGRPVILAQHFCFDSYSISSGWYLDSAALEGYNNLWSVLAPYNVVGIFCGHHHDQYFYSYEPGTKYAGGVAFPTGRLAYDVFQPGPGFEQDFGVIRVTDRFMDVQAAQDQTDFDNGSDNPNKLTPFGRFFTKRLVQTPVPGGLTQIEQKDVIATSVLNRGRTYLLGVNANGKYTVRSVNPGTALGTTAVSTGTFPIVPTFLTSYVDQGGYPNFLLSDGETIYAYLLLSNGVLSQIWKEALATNSLATVYGMQSRPYLVVDEAGVSSGVRFGVYSLDHHGAKEIYSMAANTNAEPAKFSQMIPWQGQNNGAFGIARVLANGRAEVYAGTIDASNNVTFNLVGQENWVQDSAQLHDSALRPQVLIQSILLQDKSVGILVKSPACLAIPVGSYCPVPNTEDSPYTVRTLTQDGHGTVVSWRGRIPLTWGVDITSLVSLGQNYLTPEIGLYSSDGFLSSVTLQD